MPQGGLLRTLLYHSVRKQVASYKHRLAQTREPALSTMPVVLLLADECLRIPPLAMWSHHPRLRHQYGTQCMLRLPKVNGQSHQFIHLPADTKPLQRRRHLLLFSLIPIELRLPLQALFRMLPLKAKTVGGRKIGLHDLVSCAGLICILIHTSI